MAASSPSEDGRPAKKLKVTDQASNKAEENGGKKGSAKRWLPPGFVRRPTKLHRSTAKWTGPATAGWQEFFVLDLDPKVVVKPSNASISSKRRALKMHDRGGKQLDWDASDAEENADANPNEPSSTEESKEAPTLTVPTWKDTRAWLGLLETTLDTELWKPSHLVSHVVRTRRKGRSTEGGGADLGNPQEPPAAKPDESANTLLLPCGGTSKPPSRQKVRMVKWRSPALLIVSPQVMVNPKKYKGVEVEARAKRRLEETDGNDPATGGSKSASPDDATASKTPGSSPASPPAASKGSEQYKASMMTLMGKLQTGRPESTAVRECWASLSSADRLTFSSEYPQFMSIVVGLPSSGASSPKGEPSAMVPAASASDGKGLPLAAQAL